MVRFVCGVIKCVCVCVCVSVSICVCVCVRASACCVYIYIYCLLGDMLISTICTGLFVEMSVKVAFVQCARRSILELG